MADITRAFENLNRSLRYISDSRRLRDQATQQHQEKMLRLETEINDPRRKLLQDQAQEQLRPVKVSSPIPMSTSNASSRYNQETTAMANKIWGEHGLSIDPDNPQRVIDIETRQDGMKPKHIMSGLQQDIDTLMTVRKLGYTQKQHLSELNQQISNLDKKVGGKAKDKFSQHNYGKLIDERNILEKDLVNPTKQRQNLNSRMQLLNKAMGKAVLSKNNSLTKLIDGMLNRTQKTIQNLGSAGTKGMSLYKYTSRDGKHNVITGYTPKGQEPQAIKVVHGIPHFLGTTPIPKTGGRLDKTKPSAMTPTQWGTQNDRYTKLKLFLSKAKVNDIHEMTEMDMMDVGAKGTEEANMWLNMLATNTKDTIKIWNTLKDHMDNKFGEYKEFVGYKGSDKKRLVSEQYKEVDDTLRLGLPKSTTH